MKFEDMINNIILGDCYQKIKEIPDNSIDCIYTDIPYLIENGGSGDSPLAKRIRKLNYETLKDIRDGINYSILNEFCRISKHINIFIWCSKEQMLDLMDIFIKEKNCKFNLLVWCKLNPTPMTNNTFLPDVEYCLYFRETGVQLNEGYELKSKWYLSPINKSDKDKYNHPTIKPLELVKRHIAHTTKENDIVFDPFSGSRHIMFSSKRIKSQIYWNRNKSRIS